MTLVKIKQTEAAKLTNSSKRFFTSEIYQHAIWQNFLKLNNFHIKTPIYAIQLM